MERSKSIDAATSPNHIVLKLQEWFRTTDNLDGDIGERTSAQRNIDLLIKAIQECHVAAKEARERLMDVTRKDNPDVPNVIEKTTGTLTEKVGGFAQAFMDAPMSQKAIMIAGVAAAIYAIKQGLKLADETAATKWIKEKGGKVAGITIAGVVMYMGYEAINKTVENTSGRPLTNFRGRGDLFPYFGEQKDWEKAKLADEFDRVYGEMKNMSISVEEFDDIQKNEKERFAFGIANLAGMTAGDFINLYEKYKKSGIPDGAPEYPHKPFGKDYLSDLERIALMKDMGESVKIIDETGNVLAIDEATRKKTIVYLALEGKDKAPTT